MREEIDEVDDAAGVAEFLDAPVPRCGRTRVHWGGHRLQLHHGARFGALLVELRIVAGEIQLFLRLVVCTLPVVNGFGLVLGLRGIRLHKLVHSRVAGFVDVLVDHGDRQSGHGSSSGAHGR